MNHTKSVISGFVVALALASACDGVADGTNPHAASEDDTGHSPNPFAESTWTAIIDRSSERHDVFEDVAIGPDGMIYALGSTESDAGTLVIWVESFEPDGAPGPVQLELLEGLHDSGRAMALHPEGLAIVASSYEDERGAGILTMLVSTDDGGSIVWSDRHDGPATGRNGPATLEDVPGGIGVGHDGTIYVSGHERDDAGRASALVLAYADGGSSYGR